MAVGKSTVLMAIRGGCIGLAWGNQNWGFPKIPKENLKCQFGNFEILIADLDSSQKIMN